MVYLLIESEYGGNTSDFNGAWPPGGPPQLNADVPAWADSINPRMSLRHCLPPDPSLYQSQATGVFAYADSHVAIVNANMNLRDAQHFGIHGP